MIAFRDRWRRTWSARLDVSAALRIRDLVDLDVMAVGLGEPIDDPAMIAGAIYALCQPQAELRGVSPRAFGRGLRGFVRWAVRPEDLRELLIEEIEAFFDVPELTPGKAEGEAKEPTPASLWGQIWALAGVAGVDPGPLTFGELVAIADAKRKHDWSMTANLLSVLSAIGGKHVPAAKLDPTGGLGAAGSSSKLKITKSTLRLAAMILGAT